LPVKATVPPETDLRQLYEGDGLDTRAIGGRYGVSYKTVLRWLHDYSIAVRPFTSGLWHQKGKPHPCLGRTGPMSPVFGRSPSPESRLKQSASMKGKHSLDKHPQWRGGRTLHKAGYVLVKAPGHPEADEQGYAFEHRLVAEGKISRPLAVGEVVHHINGNKADNRPENLQVMGWGEHSSHHHKGVKRSEEFRQRCRDAARRRKERSQSA
jgi:hypothetical protein